MKKKRKTDLVKLCLFSSFFAKAFSVVVGVVVNHEEVNRIPIVEVRKLVKIGQNMFTI